MRVAALNDIHGNLPALEAILAEVEREGVDAIVCGGDVVGGPFPAQVYDRLATLPHVHLVRGNADRLAIEGEREHERLGEERIARIGSWPLTVTLEVDGLGRALFCHAIPTDDEPIFTRITPDGELVELLGDVDAEVVVCGHTHIQFDRMLPTGMRVVNAGSVGMPYEGRRGAFWALLGSTVELRRTEYDVEAVAERVRRTSGAFEEQIRLLLEPPDPDEVTAYFESQRV